MERIKLFFLNAYFYAAFVAVSVLVIALLTLMVACWRIFHSHRSTMRRFRMAIRRYGKVVTRIPWPAIRVRYEDHATDDPSPPFIYVANHRSASDAFVMCEVPHELVQVVSAWPFHIPVLGAYARRANYLNVKMMEPEEFFEKAGALLREGVCLLFFPEGTRSGGRTMGNFHGQAFRLALRERAAIVPVCISGSEEIPRKGTPALRPGTIRVRRLPALRWEEFRESTPYALKNRVREIIQRELTVMENVA